MSETIPSLVVSTNMLSSSSSTSTSQDVSYKIQSPLDLQNTESQQDLLQFWEKQLKDVQDMDVNAFKVQELPLARIKKIMKMDEDVKMISAEAPLLFAKAAQMFINELSLRAWIHTEENKRRTLQRNDIATAITKFDQFDFLIDIVPREDLKPARRPEDAKPGGDNMQYFYSLPQQVAQENANQTSTQTTSALSNQVVITQGGQIVQLAPSNQQVNGDGNQQIIQLAQQQQQPAQQQSTGSTSVVTSNQTQPANVVINTPTEQTQTVISPQIIQQLISNSGASPSEIQSIQITPDGQVQIVKSLAGASENL